MTRFVGLLLLLLLVACAPPPDSPEIDGAQEAAAPPPASSSAAAPTETGTVVEATSLLGEPLYRPAPSADFVAQQEEFLAEARAALEANPDDADALIWAGRRTAYLGRYNEAIEIYGQGIEQHPDDARFLRHRGHRYLSVRRLDDAIADLTRAGEMIGDSEPVVEPDGLPNALGIPTSTLHDNIWYHLGLAHYLKGDFESALAAYEKCLALATNNDMLVATSHWAYMTLRRFDRRADADALLESIHVNMEIIENHSYHRLLMLYKNHGDEESLPLPGEGEALDRATVSYGVGNWEMYNGRPDKAHEIFESVVAGGPWASFGALAAEADLALAVQD